MKTTFTKEERNAIYRKALESIESENQYFICVAIGEAAVQIHGHADFSEVYDFPEFAKHMPINKGKHEAWFGLADEGRPKRIEVLEQCIRETI